MVIACLSNTASTFNEIKLHSGVYLMKLSNICLSLTLYIYVSYWKSNNKIIFTPKMLLSITPKSSDIKTILQQGV